MPRSPTSRTITAWGETKTPREWSQDSRSQVSANMIAHRHFVRGWHPERAIAFRAKAKRKVVHQCFGESKTLNQWAKDIRCQVRRESLIKRLAKGWSLEKAITTPAAPGRQEQVPYFITVAEAARILGVTYWVARHAAAQSEFETFHDGKHLRLLRSSVEAYMTRRTSNAA